MNNGFKTAVKKAQLSESIYTRYCVDVLQQQCFDIACMALGRMEIATPEQMVEFAKLYDEAGHDYHEALNNDTPDIEYSMAIIDRELSYYIPKEQFHSYEERMIFHDPNRKYCHLWIPAGDPRYAESQKLLGEFRQHTMHRKKHR